MSGVNMAIGENTSPHEFHFLPNTGRVPTNDKGPTKDIVNNFIDNIASLNPTPFGM